MQIGLKLPQVCDSSMALANDDVFFIATVTSFATGENPKGVKISSWRLKLEDPVPLTQHSKLIECFLVQSARKQSRKKQNKLVMIVEDDTGVKRKRTCTPEVFNNPSYPDP